MLVWRVLLIPGFTLLKMVVKRWWMFGYLVKGGRLEAGSWRSKVGSGRQEVGE
jgi:hypothetical protein